MFVIETNLRSSRSIPFVTSSTGINFVEEATRAMLHLKPTINLLQRYLTTQFQPSTSKRALSNDSGSTTTMTTTTTTTYAVKSSVFSFTRLPGADVLRGVTMKSTGEVVSFSSSPNIAFLRSMRAAKRLFPPPPGLLPSFIHLNAVVPHQCYYGRGGGGDTDNNDTKGERRERREKREKRESSEDHQHSVLPPLPVILCLRLRGKLMESKWVARTGLDDLRYLLDNMISMGYTLVECVLEDQEEDRMEEVAENDGTTMFMSKEIMSGRMSMDSDNIAGLVDICVDGSTCGGGGGGGGGSSSEESEEEEKEKEIGYLMRRKAVDLNIGLFTDLRVVMKSVEAWKEVLKQSSCPRGKKQQGKTETGKL